MGGRAGVRACGCAGAGAVDTGEQRGWGGHSLWINLKLVRRAQHTQQRWWKGRSQGGGGEGEEEEEEEKIADDEEENEGGEENDDERKTMGGKGERHAIKMKVKVKVKD